MPPDSAKAIASLICRRSKYFSRIGADGTVRAKPAGSIGVLRSELEVPGGDASRRRLDAFFHLSVIGGHVVSGTPPEIEQDEARIATSGQQASPRGQAVDAQLKGISGKQDRVQGRVGLEVDQRRLAVDLADPVDHAAH